MTDAELESLLAPLSDEQPCGPDLEYDAAFIALEAESRGKPEQQFGDTVIPAQEPNWRELHGMALDLLQRTRDLRVAVQLLRAETRLNGTTGFSHGIRLVHGLLSQQWPHVHPQLDASDNDDPTMRMNALAPLADAATVLTDLRAARLGTDRYLSARAVELALGKAEPHGDESVPGEAQLADAAAAQAAAEGDPLAQLRAAHEAVRAIEQLLDERVGSGAAPDLKPLRRITQSLNAFAQLAQGHAAAGESQPSEGATGDAAPKHGGAGVRMDSIRTRDDAIRALERVCEWIDRHEPTNPAPLLIRRAQRLMGKSFIDIIRDIAPESLRDIEKLAGVDNE